ncbi:MAG TPA: right-handed parallel beta-helix repeat-containing protein [Gemmatimonadaceae bacterium]
MRSRSAPALVATLAAALAAACSAPDAVAPLPTSASSRGPRAAEAGAGAPCTFERRGRTLRLTADCTTDRTIRVGDGLTLDGAGHTITVVDPAGDHFRGAVVENAGATASVRGLRIAAHALADVCDAGDDALAGIRLTDASGVVADNVVTGLAQLRPDGQVSGCQEGWSIVARTRAWEGAPVRVAITGNRIDRYGKEGILAFGAVAATIANNDVRGGGAQWSQAQYGIEVTTSVPGVVRQNRVTGNMYLGAYPAWAGGINSDASRRLRVSGNVVTGSSAGIQLFAAQDADVVGNTVVGASPASCPAWASAGACTFGVQISGAGRVHGNDLRSLDVGVDVLAGSERVKVSGNRMRDVGTPVRRQ